MDPHPRRGPRNLAKSTTILCFLFLLSFGAHCVSKGQTADEDNAPTATNSPQELFRLERLSVAGGAELITIHARLDDLHTSEHKWTPLVSVLRDTLGDSDPENDRLRYVWPLTYTRPDLGQRILGGSSLFADSTSSN